MRNIILSLLLYSIVLSTNGQVNNYTAYHKEVTRCEQLISEKKISEARHSLDSLFSQFDFVFLREYKLATELSLFEQDFESAFKFLRLGVLSGWSMKSIRKNKNLKPLQDDPEWIELESDYDSLHQIYRSNLNIPLRQEAHRMLKEDQKIALRIFLRIGEKNRVRYALKKFVPHSENVFAWLEKALVEQGYPGEKLIGNSWWTSVNLGHHNSISTEHTLKDTLYLNLRPELLKAMDRGELHPRDFTIIEDWRNASIHQHESSLYGFVGKIRDDENLTVVNQNREQLGLRSIELRNMLLDVEKETGLNLYLPKDWQKGKITVASK